MYKFNKDETQTCNRSRKNLWGLIILCVMTASLFIVSSAIAHNLWINISNHFAKPGETVKAYLGWGHHYPFSDFLSPHRLESMRVIMPDGTIKLLKPKEGEPGTIIDTTENGVYVVGAAMKPGYYTKTVTGHTFKSKKESRDVISSIWSEKYAKAIFCTGKSTEGTYKKPFGHSLEIIPLNNPCTLKAGDYLTVRVLMRGKPLADTFISWSCLGNRDENSAINSIKTNQKGEERIHLVTPGVWRIMVKHEEQPVDPALCDYNKYSAFLTIAVRQPLKSND